MRQILTYLCFALLFTVSSCKKDNTPTDGQVVAARLKTVVGTSSITSVFVMNAQRSVVLSTGISATIKDEGFIEVYDSSNHLVATYNLALLTYYVFESNALTLYF